MGLLWTDYIGLALNGLAEGLLIAMPALAVTLVFGVARFPNAATGDFVSVGGYGALGAYKLSGGSLVAAALGAIAFGGMAGWLAWALAFKPIMRRSGLALLLTSIGIGFVVRSVLGAMFGHDHHLFELPSMTAWRLGPISVNPMDVLVGAISIGCLATIFWILFRTSIGRILRAISDNADLARVVGINSQKAMAGMWLLTGAVTGIAGLAIGMKNVVSPDVGAELLLSAFAAAVVGGLGNPLGSVLAAVVLGIAQELSTPFVGFTYKIAIAYVVMLLVLLWRPQGLFTKMQGAR